VLDELARQRRVVHTDRDDLLGLVKEEAFREGHAQPVAERGAGLDCHGVIAEGGAETLAVGRRGRRPQHLDLQLRCQSADAVEQIGQHRLVHRQGPFVADAGGQAGLHTPELGQACEHEQPLRGRRDGLGHRRASIDG
jgi:hypothetical protein